MSIKPKAVAAVAALTLVAAAAYFIAADGGPGGISVLGGSDGCPLTGEEPSSGRSLDAPAVAVKVENSPAAWPLSGLDKADVVFEEIVEGGVTRFMAIYHCKDTTQAGPVRSARAVDPAIMQPLTSILAFSGANQTVLDTLRERGVVQVTESNSRALRRIPRDGYSSEHTLYADTAAVRKEGMEKYDEAPDAIFEFGELNEMDASPKRATAVTIQFSSATTVTYEWKGGKWVRSQDGQPFMLTTGKQVAVQNVLIAQHTVNYSKIVDVAGNPSTEIADETGSERAVLFRDGRAVEGRWSRESLDDPVTFTTKKGDDMVLAPGKTWIELLPNDEGDVKGSFSYEK